MLVKFKKLPSGLYYAVEGKEWSEAQAVGSTFELDVDDPQKAWTPSQKGSMYIWLEDLAAILNDSGLDRVAIMEELAKHGIELPWDKISTKELLWKPVLKVMSGKTSTEDQSTVDPSAICDAITRKLGQKYGVTCPPWPTRFSE